MDKFYKYLRFFAYTIEIVVFFIIERTPNLVPTINDVKPMILLPTAIIIAMFEGEKVGTAFGFFIGLLLDASAVGRIGFYSAILTCLGFFVGTIAQKIIKFNLITSGAFVITFTTVVYFTHFVFEFLFRGYSDIIYSIFNHYLIGLLYTVMLSPFLYFFNKAFAVSIKAKVL